MFKQRTHKMKISDIENLETDTLLNIMYHRVNGDKTADRYQKDIVSANHLKWGLHGRKAVRHLSKPNVTMMGYENRPGAWVFDHEPTGIVLVMFSDGHRKDPYKGTSYELANLPGNFNDEMLYDVYQDIVKVVCEREYIA